MGGHSAMKDIYHYEDSMDDSSDEEMSNGEQKSPFLRDDVFKTMLPSSIENLRMFFDPSEVSGVNKSHSSAPQTTKKDPSEALKAFRGISYLKFKTIPSSEEESCCSKDSHVDSDDSGLFKKGYVFKRKSQPISKKTVNKKVKKWMKKVSEKLDEVNKMYKPSFSKNKDTFAAPLGLEANRKITVDPPDDNSSLSYSRSSGQLNTKDEMDVLRNDEFMREVHRVLRSKKNSQTLEKRSLPEEYSRLIFKKTAFLRDWNRQNQPLALTERGDPLTENEGTGVDGDNTIGPATAIFDQLSKMVLKNKIVKQTNDVLRRANCEKRCDGTDNSDLDLKFDNKTKNDGTKNESEVVPGTINILQVCCNVQNPEKMENQSDLAEPYEFSDVKDNTLSWLKKVESYLSCVSNVQPIIPALPEIRELTTEREQSLFDSLAGEFLKSMASGNDRTHKITRNDKKLLTIIVKRYIDRGILAQIDELMNSNLNDNILEVPPYENVREREKFFLKKIMRKFIKRGMRDALEDLIAWIYYKMDAMKDEQPEKLKGKVWEDKVVQKMVDAFKNSGENPSLNEIVTHLLREHRELYPGLNPRQIRAVKEKIKDLVIGRFARMYLDRAKMDVDRRCEPYALAVNVKNEFDMKSGMEKFYVNGRCVGVQWKFASIEGESEEPHEMKTKHEVEDSSVDGKLLSRTIDSKISTRNAKAIKTGSEKDEKFVKEILKDMVWNVQQSYQRQKRGKANRTCALVKKRSVRVIGDPSKGRQSNVKGLEVKLGFEERRKEMREEHINWLLDQKEMLKDAKKKEVKY